MSGLDFSRIAGRSAVDSATEPRRIFFGLPGRDTEKYKYPRDVESEVLETWHERRDERDLVIKLNTGAGKTVVGLLVLKSSLNEKVGPAVYVTADKALAAQVVEEADQLGLETATEPSSARFQQGHAILVTNVYRLFNGRSVFGVGGRSGRSIELGTVLIDDIHACLTTVEEQFTLELPYEHPAYGELLELFEDDLAAQSQPSLLDLKEGDSSAVLPIPFWAWADRQEQVVSILNPHRNDEELRFVWPLIVDFLPICRVAISSDCIEVAPPCPPVEKIPSFERARRRIYLSATLADDSVLVTHFDADPDTIREPIVPRNANDLGDRMILTPQQTFTDCDDDQLEEFVAAQAESHNVVVIVPSRLRAARWAAAAAEVHTAETIQGGVARLRDGHVGLVVLVNKYDGIDLPGDACRVLVIDGLPEALGPLRRLENIALEGSDALLTRQVQRIEQGMGRGVRSNDDYCVVLLAGRRLVERLYPPSARAKFSPATRAQLQLSDEVAGMLAEASFERLQEVVDQCLGRDPDWVSASRGALDGVTYPKSSAISTVALARRAAFDAAAANRFRAAAERLQEAAEATADPRPRGLLREEAAVYLQQVDPVAAQRAQVRAFGDNRMLTKPDAAIDYDRLREPRPQARAATELLRSRYESSTELAVGVNALLDDLEPNPDQRRTKKFELAMKELGLHLGFEAQCPDIEQRRGPDVLWMLGERRYLVIECKSGSRRDDAPKSDMAQLTHSIDWFEEMYGRGCDVTPVLVHPSRRLHEKASARHGTRILTFDDLVKLRKKVQGFAKAVAASAMAGDEQAVWERLAEAGLDGGSFVERWTAAPRPGR